MKHLLELLARERVVQIERRAPITIGELLDAELHVRLGRELYLRPLRCRAQPFVRLPVLARVIPMGFEKLRGHMVCDADIDVIAAKKGVTRRRQHLEYVTRELQDRDVEGAAAKVVDRHALGRSLVVAVGERGSGRLVEDAQHIEAGNTPRGLRRTSLKLVEVGGHRHYRLATLLAQCLLGDLSDVPKDERANLAQRVRLASRGDQHATARAFGKLEREPLLGLFDLVARVGPPDESLDRVHGVLCVEQAALFRGATHQHITARMKRND